MSVQVEQSVTGKITQTRARPISTFSRPKVAVRLDGSTLWGIAIIATIWGGFFVAFAQM